MAAEHGRMRRLVLLALLASCSPKYEAPSSDARALLSRFPSLPVGVATLERAGESFRVRVDDPRVAVTLPVHANGAVSLASSVRVDVRLRGARDVVGEVVDGWVVYRDGVPGGAIFQRADREGAQDHVLVPTPRVLSYDLDAHGAGLRFVSDTLEVVDEGGAPRLRMKAPTLIDAQGKKHRASVSIDGCPVDRSPASPWGRAFSPANHCTISLSWSPELPHPVLVDPAWTTTSSMAEARISHRAVVLSSGKVLVAGGMQISPAAQLSSAELLDPATKTWASAGSMSAPRVAPAIANLGAQAIVVGGGLSTAEAYDATAGWTSIAALPSAVSYPTATTVGTKVLVAGGGTSTSELFDGTAWTDAGSMSVVRGDHQAHLLSTGKVLVYGGSGVSSAELWDAGTWTLAGSTSLPLGSSVLVAGNKVVAFGGRNPGDATSAAEVWAASTWTATGSLVEPLFLAPAAGFAGGVLVAGGLAPAVSGGTSHAERWNGSTWSMASPLSTMRYGNTATALPDGSVLVAGGASAGGATLSSAEIFAPLAAGTTCTVSADCGSGACLSGFCCAASCPAAACDMNKVVSPTCDATGACGTVSTDCGLYACASAACKSTCATDADCGSTAFCSGSACVAKKANGATATDAKECTSGLVADGVCCDKTCDGVCESCSTGACMPVTGAPKHGSCPAAGTDPCSATSCDGVDGESCAKHPGAEVTCRTGTCEEGVETASATCDGSGACPAVSTKTCAPYACDGPSCRHTCRSDFDCGKGSTCDTITHACLPADSCDGDHTVHGHDGVDKDCTPYKCAKTDCLKDCSSSDACVSGFICDPSSKLCVPPSSGAAGNADSGGCSYAARPASFPFLLLALLAIGRRRAVRADSRRA
jgi:hypothetical protein